ncbi:Cytochrome c [Maioricimonas rarisocia]|uniref:Cytochrome c n=1 Tax=Maioricimonas rarisocia TaxID=2528026 RepID=A0A517ZA31_9PLAN|nr:PVC-type heme-binding CxxCH protein [Maioricimonas rarisocia]QDU39344.1 Cytochrome c [Maioricimonas rarisocia]
MPQRYSRILHVAICLLHATAVAADDFPQVYDSERAADLQPMSAAEAAARMQVPDGFHVDLFAAEPDVRNPIAMAWDERGRLWIAENYTYAERPLRFDRSLRDRVLVFEDSDGDGRADSRKVFTDSVQMLTSVEVGRGGVWLMCPPQLLFFPDANGDDVPDGPAQVMLDGFDIGPDSYHNFANGLRWGPDGWLYGRCGHSCPGRIGLPGTPDEQRIPLDGGVWRFHPERKTVEVVCHGTVNPWGYDWDRHGELFLINTVIGHLWHVLPGAHMQESFGESMNPAVYERLDMIADHYHYDRSGSWTESRDGAANEYGGGHAHIGAMIYQGDRWPKEYRDRLYTINMHGRRANRERIERHGAGYIGRHEPDFFIAEDPFFRGLDLSIGPDGHLYVIDWSDTGECHEQTGVHRSSGRIFRIRYGDDNTTATKPLPKPYCLGGEGPLPELWRRYQAGDITRDELRKRLRDPDEHVRVWAIRLLTDFWPLDTIVGPRPDADYPNEPQTREALVRMAREDESGLVHLTLASTLQRLPVEHRAELAQALLTHEQHAGDRDLPLMVWFGLMPLGDEDPTAIASLAVDCRWPRMIRWMARNVASHVDERPAALENLLNEASGFDGERQMNVLLGMQDAFRGRRKVNEPAGWKAFANTDDARQYPDVVRELATLFGDGRALEEIRRIVRDRNVEMQQRQAALETLIRARPDDLRQVCQSLLNVRLLNATAAGGLALYDDPEIGRDLARNYRRFHADDRPGILELLVSRPSFAGALLDQIGAGRMATSELTAVHARQILSLGDEDLKRRLQEVWGELRESPADRRQQMEELRRQLAPSVLASADLSAGRALFARTCAQCHMLYGDGKKIGPDLTGSQRTNLDYLLQNIVDPSAVVGKDYRMTVIETVDGRVLNGLVVSRNDERLVLQTATEQKAIRTADIEEIAETNRSAMPDGLLQNLSEEQIRDLFGYLMHPGQVPLPVESVKR